MVALIEFLVHTSSHVQELSVFFV